MQKPKILVTGMTGKTGAAVVDELLAKDYPVRAVRMRGGRSAALERRGLEVVVADIFDPDQLTEALRGVRRASYLPPIRPYALHSAVAFAAAARETKLEGIVPMGQWLSHRSHPAIMTRHTRLMDHVLAELRGISRTLSIDREGIDAIDIVPPPEGGLKHGFLDGRVSARAHQGA